MNRRGFLASAIAAVLVPKELIAEPFDMMGGTFSNVLVPPGDLTEASLEQILIDIQTRGISFRKNTFTMAIRPGLENLFDDIYNSHRVDWEEMYDKPKILPSFCGSRDVVSEELIRKSVDFEVHPSHIRDGQSLFSRRHSTLGCGIGEYRCPVCQSFGGEYNDDEGNRCGECSECGL